MHTQTVRLFVVFVVVALVAAFIVLGLLSAKEGLITGPTIERPGLLAGGAALYGATLIGYALLWRTVVCRIDRVRPPAIDSIAAFSASWLGRYVPSSLPYVAGKIALGIRLGHSKAALAASLLYENAIVVSVSVITSCVVIPIALAGRGAGPLVYAGAGLGGVAGLALLSPPVFQRAQNVATRLARREPVGREKLLDARGIVETSLIATAALVLNGAGFALLLAAFTPLDLREAVAAAAIFNLAGAAGIAAVPVPSGLGVREAVLIGLLHTFVPVEIAAAAAVAARFIGIIVDAAFGLGGVGTLAMRRRALRAGEPALERQLDAA